MALGKTITATKEFTPKEADGSVTLTFKVSGALVEGKTVVAFESCKYEKTEVAIHADINDKDQTVEYPKDKTDDKPSKSTAPKKSSSSKVSSSPKTGDNNNLILWIVIALVSAAGIVVTVICIRRKRKKNRNVMY